MSARGLQAIKVDDLDMLRGGGIRPFLGRVNQSFAWTLESLAVSLREGKGKIKQVKLISGHLVV